MDSYNKINATTIIPDGAIGVTVSSSKKDNIPYVRFSKSEWDKLSFQINNLVTLVDNTKKIPNVNIDNNGYCNSAELIVFSRKRESYMKEMETIIQKFSSVSDFVNTVDGIIKEVGNKTTKKYTSSVSPSKRRSKRYSSEVLNYLEHYKSLNLLTVEGSSLTLSNLKALIKTNLGISKFSTIELNDNYTAGSKPQIYYRVNSDHLNILLDKFNLSLKELISVEVQPKLIVIKDNHVYISNYFIDEYLSSKYEPIEQADTVFIKEEDAAWNNIKVLDYFST